MFSMSLEVTGKGKQAGWVNLLCNILICVCCTVFIFLSAMGLGSHRDLFSMSSCNYTFRNQMGTTVSVFVCVYI